MIEATLGIIRKALYIHVILSASRFGVNVHIVAGLVSAD